MAGAIVQGSTPAMKTVCEFTMQDCLFSQWLVFMSLQHYGHGDANCSFPGKYNQEGTIRNYAHRMYSRGYTVGAASSQLIRDAGLAY